MKRDQVIAIYGSHDASITFVDENNNLRVFEYERFVRKRYAMFSSRFDGRPDMGTSDKDRRQFLTLIKETIKNKDIKLILHLEISETDKALLSEYFPNAEFREVGHHYSHACSGYYASKFKQALIFSVDGGGFDDGSVATTKVFIGREDDIKLLASPNIDFGNPYSGIGYLISEVSPSPEPEHSIHALSYAGKIMGLCAYGVVRRDWLEAMRIYYKDSSLNNLCIALGFENKYNSLSGQNSYDLAATSQYVFEEQMDSLIKPYIDNYNLDAVIVGGCGLNVLYNQKLKEYLDDKAISLYVPPNPNDCGLSYGMFLSLFPSEGLNEVCYSGVGILDESNYEKLIRDYEYSSYTYTDIVNLLKQGKILGVINDNSEVGPRALGNRSIICDPSIENMKDILNSKVKFREWFRPFAPVCRLKDSHLYFENVFFSKYMSYAPIVKDNYREQLKTITHIDGTARLQTVGESSNEFFYQVLDELENQGYIPVILNTSFNIRGKPILTSYEDALYVLDNTELDYVVTKHHLISKRK